MSVSRLMVTRTPIAIILTTCNSLTLARVSWSDMQNRGCGILVTSLDVTLLCQMAILLAIHVEKREREPRQHGEEREEICNVSMV